MTLSQLRCSASFLNYDLFKANIIIDPSCRCGSDREDVHHFLFDCPLYTNHREIMFNNLHWLSENYVINTDLLTCGNPELSTNENIQIFKQVQDYIKRSKRFLVT